MSEVTTRNLEDKYNEIITSMKNADFIAFDCEFSGLGISADEVSLFDLPADRYNKMRVAIEDLLVLQVGFSAFQHLRDVYYKVSTYEFYMFPRSYPFSPEKFRCDSRSLQFLGTEDFDFNRTFRDGMTYVKFSQLGEIESDIVNGKLMKKLRGNLSVEDRRSSTEVCAQVNEWLAKFDNTDCTIVSLDGFDPLARVLIRQEIEHQFKVQTTFLEYSILKVERGFRTQEERNRELFRAAVGCTDLLKEIVDLKKPIIGHNMLMDLMMFYKTFYGPLPENYDTFKRAIYKIFPRMYDTKHMAYEMRNLVGRQALDTPFSLKRLYDFFDTRMNVDLVPERPVVTLSPSLEYINGNEHNSGFDSYCTGCVFLQLAHMFSLWSTEDEVLTNYPTGNNPEHYMRATQHVQNHVNMMRGRIGYIVFGGEDPIFERPNFLLIESTNGEDVDPKEIMKLISPHDTADMRVLDSGKLLIACTNASSMRCLERSITKDGDYNANRFEPERKKKSKNLYIGFAALAAAGLFYAFVGRKF